MPMHASEILLVFVSEYLSVSGLVSALCSFMVAKYGFSVITKIVYMHI